MPDVRLSSQINLSPFASIPEIDSAHQHTLQAEQVSVPQVQTPCRLFDGWTASDDPNKQYNVGHGLSCAGEVQLEGTVVSCGSACRS